MENNETKIPPIQADKNITVNGGSLTVNVTKELKMLKLGKNDMVRVTLERIE